MGKKKTPAITLSQLASAIGTILLNATGPRGPARLAREMQVRLERNETARFFHYKTRKRLPPLRVKQQK